MKYIIYAILFVFPLFSYSQNEPEFISQVFYIDSLENVKLLKQNQAEIKLKGILNPKGVFSLQGCCSSFLVDSTNLNFIVRLKNFDYDPKNYVKVFALSEKKNERFVDMELTNAFEYTYAKYGKNSIKIHLDHLPKGEYAIAFKNAYMLSTFAVK